MAGRGGRGKRKVMRSGQIARGKSVGLRAAHGLDQVLAHQRRRSGQTLGKLVDVKDLRRDNTHLGAVIAQVAHQGSGVDALDSDDAVGT